MRPLTHSGLICLSALLAGCMVGPDYRQPEPPVPATWQAPLPHGGNAARLAEWWRQFDDPLVAELIGLAERSNPSLSQALARIEQSRANAASARSRLFPATSLHAGERRSGGSGMTPSQTVASASLDASWEIDLFGANRRGREAAKARLEGAQATWHDARVSLAAEVAQEYLGLRTCEALLTEAELDLDSRRNTEQLTARKVAAGFAATPDNALASASTAEAETRVLGQRNDCDISIKSLVALTGTAETDLRARLAPQTGRIPSPASLGIDELPAQVISHRPDVVAAERELAAASADIGGAEAARYPRLSLSGTIGPQFVRLDGAKQQASIWSFGPALDLPLFDAGLRAANVDAARARYDEALAGYKAKVRQAVREVEQSLVKLGRGVERARASRQAAEGYDSAFRAAEQRWQAGIGSQLELEELRRLAITARSQHLAVLRENVAAWIGLYRAVGGDWQSATELPH
ncbi:MAG: hypothetical protein RJA63_588 [Pseudomonadota bacterium]